jgi:flagella basal body P-ring formation protein FlgA
VVVAARALRAGEPLDGAVAVEERELPGGDDALATVPAGAVAAWPIPAGAILTATRIRAAGPRPGAAVPVVIARGGFTVEASGTLVSCTGDRSCALLPSGKRLAGTLRDGKLYVEAP